MDRNYIVINKENANIQAIAAMLPRFSEEELIAASNKGTYKRARKDIESSGSLNITFSGEPVKAVITFSDCEVTAGKALGEFMCTCPSKTVCRHIISAAIVMGEFAADNAPSGKENITQTPSKKEKTSPEVFLEEKKTEPKEDWSINPEDVLYLKEVEAYVTVILKKGLINCGISEQQSLMSLSLKGSGNCRRISALCRSAAADIESMNSRSSAFNPLSASLKLGRIINTVYAASGDRGERLLRSDDYTDQGNGKFICLGAYPYRTSSGFAGITALLYETEKKEFFTYGSGLSDIYDNTADAASKQSFKKQFRRHCHWQNEVSLETISGKIFQLINYKADSKKRISSSKQTVCIIGCDLVPENISREIFVLPSPPEYNYFSAGGSDSFCVYPISRVDDIVFDTSQQVLKFTLVSPRENAVRCDIIHSQVNDMAERFIELLAEKDMSEHFMVLRITRKANIPISLMGKNGINNFFF